MRQKGFAPLIILLIIASIAGIILLPRILKKPDSNFKKEFSKKDTGMMGDVTSKDIPVCPADTSQIFIKPFMDGDKPDFIIPLGNSNREGHVIPVDHVYPTDIGFEQNTPVYAPGDLTLIWVENKQMHNKNTDEITGADYQLNFAPCRGINLAFIHLKTLSPKLHEAIENENTNCNNDQKLEYGVQDGIPTYYVTCHPNFNAIRISAGELIGTFTGRKEKPFSGFDIGLYDYNKPAVGFINPDRYYSETNHTACFADYYSPELKAKYYAKFGDNNNGTFKSVVGEPRCGKVMYDVIGTAAGDWFKTKIKQKNMTDNDALVLITDNLDRSLAKFSMANVTSFRFIPQTNGTINREYSQIKADGQIYCYQDENNMNSDKFLIQVLSNSQIKVEKQSGTCKDSYSFIKPLVYER